MQERKKNFKIEIRLLLLLIFFYVLLIQIEENRMSWNELLLFGSNMWRFFHVSSVEFSIYINC
jgi:hypothetical protein